MHALQISSLAQNQDIQTLVAEASKFLEAAKAGSTRSAYRSDIAHFKSFCTQHSLPFLPSTPQVVALYISRLASTLTVSTIRRRLAAITNLHAEAGYPESPATPGKHNVLREVLAGIRRIRGDVSHGAEPIMGDSVRRIAAACPDNLLGLRDKALVLCTFAMGCRRSNVCSFEVSDLTFSKEGVSVLVRRSKTDPFGSESRVIAIPFGEHEETCPVTALRQLLKAAQIESGPIFRSVKKGGIISETPLNPRSIAKILKKAAARAKAASARSLRSTERSTQPHSPCFCFCEPCE